MFRPAKGAEVTLRGAHARIRRRRRRAGAPHDRADARPSFAARGVQRPVAALPGTRDVDARAGSTPATSRSGACSDVRVLGGDWGPCHIGPDSAVLEREDRRRAGAVPDQRRAGRRRASSTTTASGPSCWNDGADCHFECMYVNGSRNVTIRDSRFRDCALYDIFVTLSGPDAARVGHARPDDREQLVRHAVGRERPRQPRSARRASALALNWCQNSRARLPRRADPLQLVPAQHRDPRRPQPGSAASRTCAWSATCWPGTPATPAGATTTTSGAPACAAAAARRTDRIAGDSFPYRNATSGQGFDFRLRKDGRSPTTSSRHGLRPAGHRRAASATASAATRAPSERG